MKASELRTQTPESLRSLLKEKRLKADELRASIIQKKTKNVKELRAVRKDIARINTILAAL